MVLLLCNQDIDALQCNEDIYDIDGYNDSQHHVLRVSKLIMLYYHLKLKYQEIDMKCTAHFSEKADDSQMNQVFDLMDEKFQICGQITAVITELRMLTGDHTDAMSLEKEADVMCRFPVW